MATLEPKLTFPLKASFFSLRETVLAVSLQIITQFKVWQWRKGWDYFLKYQSFGR